MAEGQEWGGTVVPYPHDEVQRYRSAGLWGTRTIPQELSRVAELHGSQPAVSAPDGRLTYAELDARTDLIAAGLHRLGLRPGERVVFQLTNSVHTALAWYGTLKAGLIPICSLAQHRRREIATIAEQTAAAAHLVQADLPRFDLVAFAQGIAAEVPSLRALVTVGDPEPRPGTERLEDLGADIGAGEARALVARVQDGVDPDDVAVFQLSGGTTSVPKVIPRLHAEYWYNARAYAEFWGWDARARVAHLMPLIHNAGIACTLHAAHAAGACAIVAVPDPAIAAPLLARERVTDVIVNLALAEAVLGDAGLRAATGSLERLVFSGSKLPEAVARAFERDGATVVQEFGMGEGLFLLTPEGAPEAMRHHTVGVPMSPLDEVRLCRPGGDEEVADGETGELCCRGPYTIRGYYDAPERDREAFSADGFYRTGDLARAVDIGGIRCYSIEGRLKDVISRGGEKVNAGEVELVLVAHPAIAQAAVVAMPDPRLGERACAYVVLRPGAPAPTLPEVAGLLEREGLAKYKWPERLEVVEDLPRTKVGKPDKQALREDIAGRLAGEARRPAGAPA